MLQFDRFQDIALFAFPGATCRCDDLSEHVYAVDVDGKKDFYAVYFASDFTVQVEVYPDNQNEEWSLILDDGTTFESGSLKGIINVVIKSLHGSPILESLEGVIEFLRDFAEAFDRY